MAGRPIAWGRKSLAAVVTVVVGCSPQLARVEYGGANGPCAKSRVSEAPFPDDSFTDFGPATPLKAGQRRLFGYVRAQADSAPVEAAIVAVVDGEWGGLTDARGRYQLIIPDSVSGALRFGLIGYDSVQTHFVADGSSQRIDVELGECSLWFS